MTQGTISEDHGLRDRKSGKVVRDILKKKEAKFRKVVLGGRGKGINILESFGGVAPLMKKTKFVG